MQERKTVILTDSACDIPDDLMAQYNIHFIPLRIVCHSGELRDRIEVDPEKIYDLMAKELPKTSLPLPEDVTALYNRMADQGYTDAVHICISSGLSGTYNMVRLVAQEYTRLNVRVVDTKTLSMQEGFIALSCARMLAQTQDPDEIAAHAIALRDKSLGMFVIRTLEYLRKGGRIGLVEGVLGTMLQLKPVIFVNKDGIYETLVKARGYSNALDALVRDVTSRFSKARVRLAVVQGAAQQEGEKLLERLKGMMNVEESYLLPVSPVLGVHTGPGLLGVIACEV